MGGDDVRAAYLAGVQSPELLGKYVALQLDMLCRGFLPPANQVVLNTRVLHERGVDAIGIANAEAAIQTLRRRCEPLLRITRTELDLNEKKLREAINLPGSPFEDMRRLPVDATDAEIELRRAHLRHAFAVDEYAALLWAEVDLIDFLAVLRARGKGSVIDLSELGAAILAQCELGLPCGSDRAELLQYCAATGTCYASMFDIVMSNWPNAQDRERLLRQRDELVAALQARDWVRLGLQP